MLAVEFPARMKYDNASGGPHARTLDDWTDRTIALARTRAMSWCRPAPAANVRDLSPRYGNGMPDCAGGRLAAANLFPPSEVFSSTTG
jgi:hypothetical protein